MVSSSILQQVLLFYQAQLQNTWQENDSNYLGSRGMATLSKRYNKSHRDLNRSLKPRILYDSQKNSTTDKHGGHCI